MRFGRKLDRELGRLEKLPSASPEHNVIRSYVELVLELPWNVYTQDNLDIAHARQVLDEDHFGLKEVKERILEHLGVLKMNPNAKAPILCLVGPPGVGKTSLGQSIARALGRKFERMSLGGMHDEAELRGHRRTYIGAMPGRLIQAVRRAKAKNPVLMLDEIDKLGRDYRGDPAAALLEDSRSRAEQDVPRQLPRSALGLVEDAVHHNGEYAGHHPAAVARSHGDSPALGLHGRGESRNREEVLVAAAAERVGCLGGTGHHLRRDASTR